MNTPMTATHVFYSPSDNSIVDTCTDENPPRSHVNRLTLEEIHTRSEYPYPDAVYMEWEAASDMMDEKNRLPVREITKEYFWEMLEVLPPENWIQEPGNESFKMMEYWSGQITSIYARIGKRYFTLRDNASLKHNEIMRRCREFMESHK